MTTDKPRTHPERAIAPLLVGALGLWCTTAIPTAGAEPSANIGTLICMMSPGDKGALGTEREVSCTFTPVNGAKARFTGLARRIGAETPGEASVVLAWAVLGPGVTTPARQLEGSYVGNLEEPRGGAEAGLVGGAGASIVLRPLTVAPELGENAAVSVLELSLAAMRA